MATGRRLAVTGADDTEAVALGIGEHDKVSVTGIKIPVDALGTQGHQPPGLGGLIGRVPGVQVQMDP